MWLFEGCMTKVLFFESLTLASPEGEEIIGKNCHPTFLNEGTQSELIFLLLAKTFFSAKTNLARRPAVPDHDQASLSPVD
jgi:hypothetical protein